MQFDLVIKGGIVVTSENSELADIGIRDGLIAKIGDIRTENAAEVFDAKGLSIIPGLIDTQVHFREPGMEHKEDIESGTRSAVAGGVTTVLEMPNTQPPTTTREALEDKIRRSQGRAWSHIGFFVGAAVDNLDQLAELERLPGTPGIKLFMGSSTGTLLVPDDSNVRQVLINGRKRVPVHSEDYFRLEERKALISADPKVQEHPFLRDAECARLCTERLLRLSKETGRPVHVLHLSTLEEIPLIAEAQRNGVDVTVEITPQHLWFAAPEAYDKLGSMAQMNPPIRSAEHRDALRAAFKSGFFNVIGSDHAPHTLAEKAEQYPKSPSGMPGVQTILPAMLTLGKKLDLLDLPRLVHYACEQPARLYGIRSKGFLKEGFDADLTILDPNATFTFVKDMVQSKCGWSPYEGEQMTGRVIATLIRGGLAYREGEIQGNPQGTQPTFE